MSTATLPESTSEKKGPALYGKAEAAANAILDAFRKGTIPKALAPVFIHRTDDVPCRAWSWSNQLIAAINGTSDARGYRHCQPVRGAAILGVRVDDSHGG